MFLLDGFINNEKFSSENSLPEELIFSPDVINLTGDADNVPEPSHDTTPTIEESVSTDSAAESPAMEEINVSTKTEVYNMLP